MSIICYYVSAAMAAVPALQSSPDTIFEAASRPAGVEVMDIDKAYEALAWLSSPLKRAEVAHNTRLMRDPDWPIGEARASVAALNAMAMDDELAAFEGRTDERIDRIDFGMGGASFFPPPRVRELSSAISSLSEDDLRAQADFKEMDRHDVQPGYWLEEGDDLLETYLLPGLRRLKSFYESAASKNEAVLVVCI